MKRTAVATACIAAFLMMAIPNGLAHGTLKPGKYYCYSGSYYVTSIHFKSSGVYISPVGSTDSGAKGKWSHNPDGAVIKFNGGPLDSRKLRAKHVKVGSSWAVNMYVRKDGVWAASYTCGTGT